MYSGTSLFSAAVLLMLVAPPVVFCRRRRRLELHVSAAAVAAVSDGDRVSAVPEVSDVIVVDTVLLVLVVGVVNILESNTNIFIRGASS